MENPKPAVKKILILCLQGLGNTLLFTPTLRLLRQDIPGAEITVMVSRESSRQLLSGNPDLDSIYFFDPRRPSSFFRLFRLLQRIRSVHFDVCLTAFPANRREFNLLSWLSGAGIRIGHCYPHKSLRSLSFLQNFRVPLNLRAHDVDQNLALLSPLGIKVPDAWEKRLDIVLEPEHIHFAQQWLRAHKLNSDSLIVGFHPGSSPERGMIHKRWPAKHFAQLASLLGQEYKAKIIIFGGPEEESLKAEVAGLTGQALPGEAILVAPSSNFKETAALISSCRLFISNDTGLMHVATAVGVPTLGIFGPTDEVRTRPWINGRFVARPDLDCRPCWTLKEVGLRRRCLHRERICLSRLSPEAVFKAGEKMIGEMKSGL
ncbi:MAG: glycosyltransferase family 9 protein [Nitrospirae bacterium]|nr:glycosyltransferase family 9 protein [Nitrospirota bacterium]